EIHDLVQDMCIGLVEADDAGVEHDRVRAERPPLPRLRTKIVVPQERRELVDRAGADAAFTDVHDGATRADPSEQARWITTEIGVRITKDDTAPKGMQSVFNCEDLPSIVEVLWARPLRQALTRQPHDIDRKVPHCFRTVSIHDGAVRATAAS